MEGDEDDEEAMKVVPSASMCVCIGVCFKGIGMSSFIIIQQ